MTTHAENELLTQVGPGTPMGRANAAILDAGLPFV
jgi:hypothetical protein